MLSRNHSRHSSTSCILFDLSLGYQLLLTQYSLSRFRPIRALNGNVLFLKKELQIFEYTYFIIIRTLTPFKPKINYTSSDPCKPRDDIISNYRDNAIVGKQSSLIWCLRVQSPLSVRKKKHQKGNI